MKCTEPIRRWPKQWHTHLDGIPYISLELTFKINLTGINYWPVDVWIEYTV